MLRNQRNHRKFCESQRKLLTNESTLTRAVHCQSGIATGSPRTFRHITALPCALHRCTDTNAARLSDTCFPAVLIQNLFTGESDRDVLLQILVAQQNDRLSPTERGPKQSTQRCLAQGSVQRRKRAQWRNQSSSGAICLVLHKFVCPVHFHAMRHRTFSSRSLFCDHTSAWQGITRDDEGGAFATSA